MKITNQFEFRNQVFDAIRGNLGKSISVQDAEAAADAEWIGTYQWNEAYPSNQQEPKVANVMQVLFKAVA